jgi:hypothetical protein
MNRGWLVLILIVIPCVLSAQNGEIENQSEIWTHTIELKTPYMEQAAKSNVCFIQDEKKHFIQVEYPDKSIEKTEYILLEDDTIKFQWTAIRRDQLLTIQYIGTGSLKEGFQGIFTALVDGKLREDMSGQFKIVRNIN